MSGYKDLFIKSQAEIADTIEHLEIILEELKKCMQDSENEILFEKNKIIKINVPKDS